MAKISAKNAVILIGGYNLSTYATTYEAQEGVDVVEVTGFGDGSHNFIPGQRTAQITANMLWDITSNTTVDVLKTLTAGRHITIVPEGYTLGTPSLSLPYMQANFNPAGDPGSAVGIGTIQFSSYGDNAGVEAGYMLAHGTITDTTSGSSIDLGAGYSSAACSATLHIWTACASDPYAVIVEDSANDSDWDTLVTLTLDGSAVGSERVAVAAGTVNRYLRYTATRTGAAGDNFGFSVHVWVDPNGTLA